MTSDEQEWQERPAVAVATQVIAIWECEQSQCREHGNHLLAASEVVYRAFDRVRAEERERCARIAETVLGPAPRTMPTELVAAEDAIATVIARKIRGGKHDA
jgi:hypothetical protein